jgi:hypothetical protein
VNEVWKVWKVWKVFFTPLLSQPPVAAVYDRRSLAEVGSLYIPVRHPELVEGSLSFPPHPLAAGL